MGTTKKSLIKLIVFQEMFIASNFFSRRDTEKLKTPLYFFGQDASKHASGDLEKSILRFDPRTGLLTPTHYVQILRSYRNTPNQNLKVFSHTLRHME